jgi:hypothetical protein
MQNNLIENDPLVKAIFASIQECEGEPIEKLRAVIRAGKVAEAFTCGGTALNAVEETFSTIPLSVP